MQNRKKAPEGFYSAKEAIATIGIPTSSFYHLVKAGTIKGVVLPGRKEAIYSKSMVDRYARAIASYLEKFNEETMSFGLALAEDIEEIRDLVAANCGGLAHTVPADVMEAWTRKNPQALHVLRRGSEIIGYVSMFPLPLDTILKRMTGEYWNRSLPIDDIQPYIPGESIYFYIAELVVSLNDNQHKRIGTRLIREVARFLQTLAEQDIRIIELYSVGTSAFGIRTAYSLGMKPLDIPEGTRPDRIPFFLDIESSTSPIILEYRRVLQAAQVASL